MSAKRLICADKIIDLPSLFLVLPELVWLRIIRRVWFQNDFFLFIFLFKFIFLKFFL